MKRTFRDYVVDILTSFEETQGFTQGLDFDAFARDRRTVNAVMRDKLIHEYSGVDVEIVWGVVKTELPPLKPVFDRMLQDLEKP